jgi:hypothetical protein
VTAWGQVRALVGLRWRLVRSVSARIGLLALLALVPLLAWAMIAARTGVEPAALVAAVEAAPAALLGFGALAVIAPLTASNGSELVPSSQLVAYPIKPATLFLSSLVLAPVNLVWIVQLLVLIAETGFLTLGTPSLTRGLITTGTYVLACTLVGQALAWLTTGLRASARGRLAIRVVTGVLVVAGLVIARLGRADDLVDQSYAPRVTRAIAAGGRGDLAQWLPTTGVLAALAVVAAAAGVAASRWALRQAPDRGADRTSRDLRRRGPVDSSYRALLAVDRASVWRAPALRRGALVLAILPGIAAAGVGLPWRSLVFLPGLVAAGGGLLFGFNAFCLDGSGAVWVATLPHSPSLVARAKARVTAEAVFTGVVLAAGIGALRAPGLPTATEATAILASGSACALLVVALCTSSSVRKPYRADLNGPRDAVAPPGAMMLASTRLALPAAFVGAVLQAAAIAPQWWVPLVVAAPVMLSSALWIARSLRRYDQPLVRSRIVQVVSAG